MKYLDTSIVIAHVVKDSLEHESCKAIIQALVSKKEKALFSGLNISEIFYVLQREKLTIDRIRKTIHEVVKMPGITLAEVSNEKILEGLTWAEKYQIDLTDAVTYLLMKKYKIKEIYSLDKHYDKFKDIHRLTELKA